MVCYQVQEVLTLSLCCSVLWAAWLWSCSVSRSRLHPSWIRATKRGEDEENPQRDRYVMWWRDWLGTILRRRDGGRRRDWVILGRESERERGYARQRESKSFSQLHRDRLFDLNCVLWTSLGLRRKPSSRSQPIRSRGRISGKVGRKCNVKKDRTFPWQQNLTVAINYLAALTISGRVKSEKEQCTDATLGK